MQRDCGFLLFVILFTCIIFAPSSLQKPYGPEMPCCFSYNFGSFLAVKEKACCNGKELPCHTFDEFYELFLKVKKQQEAQDEFCELMEQYEREDKMNKQLKDLEEAIETVGDQIKFRIYNPKSTWEIKDFYNEIDQ